MIAPSPLNRALFFMLFDILISLGTLYLAYNLRFNFEIEPGYLDHFFGVFSVLVVFKVAAIFVFRIYHVSWRFISLHEAKKILYAHAVAYMLFVGVYYLFPEYFIPFSRSVLIIDIFLSVIFIGLFRMAKRLLVEGDGNKALSKTLLIGISPFGQTLLKEKNDLYIGAIVDDSPMIINSYIANRRVRKMEDMENIVKEEGIGSAIIAKAFEPDMLISLYSRLNILGIYDIRVVSLEKKEKSLKKITVEDLLARHPKDLDLKAIKNFIKDKSILITGAGGSIGSEITLQCKKFGASSLILVDHSEYNLYRISEKVDGATVKLLNISDRARLSLLIKKEKPDLVMHAAAYKHVPICESNQDVAIQNNVLGTKNVIDVSIENSVEKVVIISTDKAVRPTNIMGATKRVAELYANNVNAQATEIVAVRFGNVLGSSGSVIPKFKQQIEQGGPVTVTHPEITRYFMLVSEACQLVLQAAAIAKGGELFVLDMGEPVKIVDLAKQMIRLYGKEEEVEIVFSGLRPGEKLYEELLIHDHERETRYRSIFIAEPTEYPIEQLEKDIEILLCAENKAEALRKIVPEFTHNTC